MRRLQKKIMKLSIVIPAYNEEESITETIDLIEEAFSKVNIEHEIFIVNDNSSALSMLSEFGIKYPGYSEIINPPFSRISFSNL